MKEITNKTLKIILFSELRSILNRKFDEMKQNFGAFILMRNYNKIDQQKQLQVACNAGAGLTTPENANISNVSKSTVSRILQIMKNWDKPNSNSDTLSQFRFHFVPMNIKSSHITNIEISYLSQQYDIKMSESTVNRNANSLGFETKYQQP